MSKKRNTEPKRAENRFPGWKRTVLIIFSVLFLLEGLYFFAVYTKNPFISKWRSAYIDTAMSTMRHQWLATAFLPKDVIQEVMDQLEQSRAEQVGVNSTWTDLPQSSPVPDDPASPSSPISPVSPGAPESSSASDPTSPSAGSSDAEKRFYSVFYELDRGSMAQYLQEHPDALQNGWEALYINEAGLNDKGTSIQTTSGDQVLAVDAVNGILLIRIRGTGYRGVLAIAKDASRLTVETASSIGVWGEYAGTIADAHGGVLAMTASSFIDEDAEGNLGKGNGGIICGYAMSNGTEYGDHMSYGYKRMELHRDNLMYLTDALSPVCPDTRDAVEFTPAMIIDGKIIVDQYCGWNAVNPRACIGQNSRKEVMMLCIEGRLVATSLGTGVVECANIMSRYDCVQAMNLDGGTSAILWYQGEYVIQCSNVDCPYGRTLPNAFVYAGTRLQ